MPAKKKAMGFKLPVVAVWMVLGALLAVAVWMTVAKTQKSASTPTAQTPTARKYEKVVDLPNPSTRGGLSVEQTLNQRRSRREWVDKSLTLKQVGQLMWAAQGVTAQWGGRAAPSAKEAYPMEMYVVVNNVEGLDKGVYHYIPGELKGAHHQLGLVKAGDIAQAVADAIVQSPAKGAPVVIIEAANFDKMTETFGKQMDNNVYLEAGHVAQNLYLQTESLGIGMVTIAGFDGAKEGAVIGLPSNEKIIYAIPVGHPKQTQG